MLTKITDDFYTDLELITNFEFHLDEYTRTQDRFYAEYVSNGIKYIVVGEKAANLKNEMAKHVCRIGNKIEDAKMERCACKCGCFNAAMGHSYFCKCCKEIYDAN